MSWCGGQKVGVLGTPDDGGDALISEVLSFVLAEGKSISIS
jgi:hypothetical protein